MRSHSVTRHKWTCPGLTPAMGRYLIYIPCRDGRLSWPRWLFTYRDGLPMQVLTQKSQVRHPNHCTTKPPCLTFLSMSMGPPHPSPLSCCVFWLVLAVHVQLPAHWSSASNVYWLHVICQVIGRSSHTCCSNYFMRPMHISWLCVNIRPILDVFVCFCRWPEAMITYRVRMVNQVLRRSHYVRLVDRSWFVRWLTDNH